MPKDPKRNVDRYKVAGGELNEFEFHQNQGKVKESAITAAGPGKAFGPATPTPATPTPAKATAPNSAAAKKPANAVKGATAKKLAANKGAKKIANKAANKGGKVAKKATKK
jgi:hypothetical protein